MTRKFNMSLVGVGALIALVACTAGVDSQEPRTPRTLEEFNALFQEYNNWGRWGADDERGTMNLITEEKTREAAALVRRGVTVSLAHNPMPDEAMDNPDAAFNHTMGQSLRSDTYEFTYHGYGVSHIDSLCHFLWNDRLYNDILPSESTPDGCGKLGIQNLKTGIVTRGILLDIARLKDVVYLEPETPIYVEDIEAWEEHAGITLGSGDALLLRTGRWAIRSERGPTTEMSGWDASVMPFMAERDIALLGADSVHEAPDSVPGLGFNPIHRFAIVARGMNLLDNLDLEAAAETAARLNRWEFMLVIAPLRVPGGTGSPVNPLAIF